MRFTISKDHISTGAMAHAVVGSVGRLRGGGDYSDDEEGPDADLTLGIMANYRKKFEADGNPGTRLEGKASGKKQAPVAENDAAALEDEARALKKRKKKGALDRLEKRERSRSSTPLSDRQDSEQESPGQRRKKKRKAFHEVESALFEAREDGAARSVEPTDGSSEEEGQIFEQAEETALDARDGMFVGRGKGFSASDNGADLDKRDTDLSIRETSNELRKESKVRCCVQLFTLSAVAHIFRVWLDHFWNVQLLRISKTHSKWALICGA